MFSGFLTSLRHYLGNTWRVSEAQKRTLQEENENNEITIEPQRKKKYSRMDHSLKSSNRQMQFPSLSMQKKTSNPSAEQKDDVIFMGKKGIKSMNEMATRRSPLGHDFIADFRFVPSRTPAEQPDPHPKHKSKLIKNPRGAKPLSTNTKAYLQNHSGSVVERLLGKRTPGILSSKTKYSLVQRSFLHEEKMKYRQLLQQYTEDYLTPASKTVVAHRVSSSPVGMISRSQWTPLMTKQKQEHIENISSVSSSTKQKEKIAGLKVNIDQSQEKRNSAHIPVIDLSQESKEDQNSSDTESDGDSVIMISEVLSPQSQRNSLAERLKEHPVYDLDWVKTLRKEYEDRARKAKTDVDATSKLIKDLERKRTKDLSLDDKLTQRLKLLDLTYPSNYTEIQIPDEEEEPLVPLTAKMENEVDDALNGYPASKVLIEKFHIQITRRDIKTLDGLNWLNDEVINFYMNLVMERSQKNDNYPRVYAFNTFFYPKLSKSGYQSVRRWTKKVDLFSYDLLLVPVHLGMHWCMSVVDFKMKCISYYDSMLGNNERCLQSLLEYLEKEHQDKKSSSYSTSDWKLQNKKDIPQQMNGSDCGMFACKFGDYLSRHAKINFDQKHMPYFRRRMVYEIIHGKLL